MNRGLMTKDFACEGKAGRKSAWGSLLNEFVLRFSGVEFQRALRKEVGYANAVLRNFGNHLRLLIFLASLYIYLSIC